MFVVVIRRWLLDALQISSTYLFTSASTSASAVANALIMKLNCTPASSASVERLFSASAQVLITRRCQDKTPDMHIFLRSIDHSQALKHDVDIPDNLGAGHRPLVHAVDSRNVTYWLC